MWLLIVTVIVFNAIFLFMPKRLTPIELFSTCMFAMVLQQLVDLAFDLKLDWYGYFAPGVQWAYYIAILGIYPAVNAIFLNYYQFMKSKAQKFWYLVGWCIFAVVYEWLAIKSGYFYYHQWKVWYSAISYPFLYMILLLVLKTVRALVRTSVQTET
ncbi:CBO0543 family protein [Paenibacillus silvisoli]|uniref:CBO0543 family protein n=1 Tax=Paenibacillus silvisoli TaxID=3110539 RepID=UPI0028041683|nr:CBO0543 family protein [Paenibacillus silvisoli]